MVRKPGKYYLQGSGAVKRAEERPGRERISVQTDSALGMTSEQEFAEMGTGYIQDLRGQDKNSKPRKKQS